MNVETYYLIWMVISATLTILIYFVSKRQLEQAILDSKIEWILLWIDIWVELTNLDRKFKHREDCRKSRAKIKKEKEQKKKIIEDTTVVRVVDLPPIESTLDTNKQT